MFSAVNVPGPILSRWETIPAVLSAVVPALFSLIEASSYAGAVAAESRACDSARLCVPFSRPSAIGSRMAAETRTIQSCPPMSQRFA